MRIALVTVGHIVTDARVTQKQAVSLAEIGHQVAVFACGKEVGKSSYKGVELHALRQQAQGLRHRFKLAPRLTGAAIDWKPDVIACHDPIALANVLKARRNLSIPVVFDCHELHFETLPSRLPWPASKIVRSLSAWSLARLGRKCDWITVVSPPSRDFYLNARGDEKVTVIHNSPRAEWCPPCNHSATGTVTVCHEGNLNTGRGLVQMLEALAIARKQADIRLMLIGKVEDQDKALYEQTVERLNVAEHVDGPKWVSYDQVGASIAKCQIGLVVMQPTPNNFRSLSNKVYNYMGSGLPVIGMAGSATGSLIQQYNSGILVDPTDAAQIAASIVKLAADVKLRSSLGKNGRVAIAHELGWEHMALKLKDIYEAIAV